MSAFDELERQLAESVAARRRPRHAAAIGGLARWWRGRLHAGLLASAASVLMILVALSGPSPIGRARAGGGPAALEWASAAGAPEGSCPPCRAVGGRLHAPLSEEETAAAGAHRARAPRGVLVRRGIPTVLW